MDIERLIITSHKTLPVITTAILAELYGTDVANIKMNYSRNADRFIEGKHYFKLEGQQLREFKHRVTVGYPVKIARNVRSLTLWTERGAARHAKILETDQAWEVFERLEDCYFNQPGAAAVQNAPPPATHQLTLTDAELNSLAWLWCACSRLLDIDAQLMPLLEAAEHRLAPQVRTMISEYGSIIRETQQLLARETAGIHCDRWQQGNWCKTLPLLRA